MKTRTTAWTDFCSCKICIPHIPVGYAGGRAPTVGALGDAGAIAEDTKFYIFLCILRGAFVTYVTDYLQIDCANIPVCGGSA
ncbi:MAG: hypothetical protein Q8L79_13455 [Methylobacter sp.]|uniref:hypothetical protein n=1 Tax=Methylobacter sp. TaxID=2051955 RepID=UPI00272F2A41|nr:hypothetical protein [Methylobacter sp.]MDP1666112.1 hypothetical protein [Methylobacter sp.]MDP1970282.1 hypothetical protein [Methylobacter sp.]